ncbi:MAG: ABC transporter permease [Bacteroidia bacterium]|nr:ABC transporter permease [Bacteroidia bacterium]MDW8416837.1 ABC transporter permease [Bacteroidia bacterium]
MSVEVTIKPSRGLRIDLGEIWRYRELLYSIVLRDIKIRYKQTVIGVGWALLQPLAMMLLFTLFFGRFIKLPTENMPYAVFALSGSVFWTYFSGALSGAANSLQQYRYLIGKIYFPRLILPLASILIGVIDLMVSLVLLIVFTLIYGVQPNVTLLLIPIFALAVVFASFSIGVWLSALNALYYDIRYILPFFIQIWLFASPVVYPASAVPEKWRLLYELNPMVGILEGFRWCIAGAGHFPSSFWISMVVCAMLFFTGVLYFYKIESTIADLI